ncbi:helix-turn-helix transcriptional regulator [Actinotalea caeni]|uniref:helix-turn-helix transcriptional regulator n=1 Tax=Actinotalea caeni TaxID=1348467 RepID=UPI0012E1BF8E|nr:YafY family protein [Actinotalea caeni]
MLATSARLLQLLTLLQTRRAWRGTDLAERLGVGTRTVRNDVARLRELGYPVESAVGRAGGYRLGAGATLPPLLLDDDEACAVAVGLRAGVVGGVLGMAEASVQALTKLDQMLPSRVRHRVARLAAAIEGVPAEGPPVAVEVLTAIAGATQDRQQLRFDYTTHDGAVTRRAAEPHRLVHVHRHWYLLAWDVDRADWRTFRVDRIALRTPNGPRFVPRDPPDPDVGGYVERSVREAIWQHRARILLHAPLREAAERVTPAIGTLEAVDESTCELRTGADTLPVLAVYLGFLGFDFEVLDPPELLEHVRVLADRYGRAAGVHATSGCAAPATS